jgi:CheY-like chemotaxis protein
MTAIRLLIVDDHPIMRDGLRGVFSGDPGFEVVGEAGDGAEAVQLAQRVAAAPAGAARLAVGGDAGRRGTKADLKPPGQGLPPRAGRRSRRTGPRNQADRYAPFPCVRLSGGTVVARRQGAMGGAAVTSAC